MQNIYEITKSNVFPGTEADVREEVTWSQIKKPFKANWTQFGDIFSQEIIPP